MLAEPVSDNGNIEFYSGKNKPGTAESKRVIARKNNVTISTP